MTDDTVQPQSNCKLTIGIVCAKNSFEFLRRMTETTARDKEEGEGRHFLMTEKVVISSYPVSVVIGNYRWRPGLNRIPEAEWNKIHWPSVERDLRLRVEERKQDLAVV